MFLAVTHPILTIGLVIVLLAISAFILVKLFGFVRRRLKRKPAHISKEKHLIQDGAKS
jgi:hypothetical protein